MINRKTLSALAIATLLTGCSATDFVSSSFITEYEGLEAETIRDKFGAPKTSESMESGKSLDTYHFRTRMVQRTLAANYPAVSREANYPTVPREGSSANRARILTSEVCKLEVLYGTDGLVESAQTMPRGCTLYKWAEYEMAEDNAQS